MMRSILLTLAACVPSLAQSLPPSYVCGRAEAPIIIDGRGDDAAWQGVQELSPLRDIEGNAIEQTSRIKMLWDDEYLYILADMDEKHLWATKTEHDSIIYHDPDFEVFIDPDGDGLNYIELEINALNTTWDLFIPRPYRFGDPHILHDWEIPGLKHAVHLRGTLNNPADADEGWSVELAIPWKSITGHAHLPRRGQAPAPGSEMRMNFSRVNWQVKPDAASPCGYTKLPQPESNHVWASTGRINIHLPEHWGRIIFSKTSGKGWHAAPPAPHEATRLDIFRALNDQLAIRGKTGAFARKMPLPAGVNIQFSLPDFFILTATCPQSGRQLVLDSRGNYSESPAEQKQLPLYLWVHGNKERSAEEWQSRFRRYAAAGISTLIIDGSPARIAELTLPAREAGLQVFAWLWALNRPGDELALQHPEWYAVNAKGKSCHRPGDRPFVDYYQFLCPNNDEVKNHLLNQVRQLAAIPGLSGIQMDYMRLPDVELPCALWDKYGLDMSRVLPEFDYCYCNTCSTEFGKELNSKAWHEFRLQSVADLFNTLAAEIRRQGLVAACAVFPSPELASRMVYQDWSRFRADMVLPMAYHSFYNETANWPGNITRSAMQQTEGRIPLIPGIHLPDVPAEKLPEMLRSLRAAGACGIGIFSEEELTPEHLEQLQSITP